MVINRKFILGVSAFALVSLSGAQQEVTGNQRLPMQTSNPAFEAHRQAAIQINELAAHIRSLDESRALVDNIATIFADNLPPEWTTRIIRDRIARAEYESATDPKALIPEQRIVNAWNKYVRAIGASQESLVNVAEIHNLRNGYYVTSRALWSSRSANIWTVPNIYAVGAGGEVADGCRAVETLRVIADITNLFENLRAARERVQKGIAVSDQFQQSQDKPAARQARFELKVGPAPYNPVQAAAIRYVREQGMLSFSQRVQELLDDLFPAPALQ